MKKFILSLLLIALLAGCAKKNNCNYPPYPLPSEKVLASFDKLAASDPEIREWGNRLLDLCQVLGTCEGE